MNRVVEKSIFTGLLSMALLASQGCGVKWLQSDGSSESAFQAANAENFGGARSGDAIGNSDFPGFSPGGSSGELSGLSQNPVEERLALAQAGVAASLSPSDVSVRRRAELTKTKEEKAALEAGLEDVFFGYDQWTLSNLGMEALNRGASYLKDHPGAVLKIEGHCDERGTSDYNMILGDKRAKAARAYLIEAGVNPNQIAILSYGKERPFCFEHDESCYQQNRRGHMLLSTKK